MEECRPIPRMGEAVPADASLLRRRLAEALAGLLDRVDAKEGHAHRHAQRVARLAEAVAAQLGVEGERRATLQLGAFLHDIGKLAVPDAILRKPAPLTAEEWEVMRSHSEEGERVLAPIVRAVARLVPEPCSRDLLTIVRSHHERWDGHGYPDGVAGEEIALGARIVAICDAFEAMTEARPYRPPRTREAAFEELLRHAGTQWDPACVDSLLGIVTESGIRFPARPLAA